jgi:hypothetical protein
MKHDLFSQEFLDAIHAIDEIWPYKRVRAPQHVLDVINEGSDEKTVEFAITVARDVEVIDQIFIDAFKFLKENKGKPVVFGDSNRPPKTGLAKRQL